MSSAGFDEPAPLPTEAGLPTELIKHEMVGDEVVAEKIVDENPLTTTENNENGDGRKDLDFLYEKDSSDEEEDEVAITIGEIRKSLPFQKQTMAGKDKIDMDGQPTLNGTMIYDLDLATMEDKPWQKPGADITDYFNYGFNEETWNSYCERQRKLRAEYGTQKEVNRAIVNSINISFNAQQGQQNVSGANYQGGRQLINIVGPEIPQKGNTMTFDFTKPPPTFTFTSSDPNTSNAEDKSPSPSSSPANISNVPVFNAAVPPPNFNPNIPPPEFPQRTITIPPVNLNLPPPNFNQQPTPRYAFAGFNNNQPPQGQNRVKMEEPGVPGGDYSSTNYNSHERTRGNSSENSDDEYKRRKRRKRSRSASPRRRKDDKTHDYREKRRRDSRDDREKRRRDDDYDKDRKRRKYDRKSSRHDDRREGTPELLPPGMD